MKNTLATKTSRYRRICDLQFHPTQNHDAVRAGHVTLAMDKCLPKR